MSPSWIIMRGGVMLSLGLSMQANGQALEAERLLDDYESPLKNPVNLHLHYT